MWSLPSSFVTAVLAFVLWRPRQQVFLDRICISKNNDDLKAASIFSLAGILNKSDEMLVLWDPTWSDRLWCVFELAAFLKSKVASEQVLLIRPTVLGPCSISLFIAMFVVMLPVTTVPAVGERLVTAPLSGAFLFLFIVAYFISASFRQYFRSIEALKEKLRNISFDNTRCSCCDLGHVDGGRSLMCDRRIVIKCVDLVWQSRGV
ncbi:unnamed protein product [Durusdinium trenchii]|uniref:Uncharacterized protein n=1 Tax=Durusdinium trenchii TaxID=1381693 RepID=A0ABP0S2H2_9DINO